MADQKPPDFWIGSIPIYGKLVLSPMDGVTDLPFRVLSRRLGSAMSYTEFINAIDVLNEHPFLPDKLTYLEEERPVVFQIFDDDPDRMVKAARILEALHPDIIDVNMGCPAKTVSSRGAGSGLLKEPQKIAEIMHKLTTNLMVPITAKIRLGWDEDHRNFLEVARIIEEEGGRLIAVHGRTRTQGYGGRADWDAIAEIKQKARIPVLGNGDVCTTADVERILVHTGCDGVMIGRAAIENPWIFSGKNRNEIDTKAVYETMLTHFQANLDFHGKRGLMLFRKFAKRYLKPYPVDDERMHELMTCEDAGLYPLLLEDTFKRFQD
jgi:tRNA-dihydrouridine synthase B